MARARKVFVCRDCGGSQGRWLGKCPDCGAWDTLEEQRVEALIERDPHVGLAAGLGAGLGAGAPAGDAGETPAAHGVALPLAAIAGEGAGAARITSDLAELDRVLGGGLVPGSAVLVGGEPGIGKSTLLLQAAIAWAKRGRRVLYVSSEESAQQVKLRAERLGLAAIDEAFVLADTNLARIVEQARRVGPAVIVIDSIQMVYKSDLPAAPGSIAQLRRCGADLVYLAKASGVAVVLVGHVTKDGQLAGPRLLEHLVDAVVYFEGDRFHAHRIVRAVKNRFGTTLEIGLFEMTGAGLAEARAGALLAGADATPRPGSVVCPVMTGTRCVLVEVQALTATGFLGAAKRKCSGLDPSRLAMIVAVLEQHAELRLADRDIFASSVGGMRVIEPAADLALLLAIAGAHHRRALAPMTAAVGEVGLGGELRPVPHLAQRVRDAARLGFRRVLCPRGPGGKDHRTAGEAPGAEVVAVRTIAEALAELG